jgi:hypothetical protein
VVAGGKVGLRNILAIAEVVELYKQRLFEEDTNL